MILFLNDVGGSEVFVILLVVLIFFGPKSIPGLAKTFGKTIYQIKQASDDIKNEVTKSGLNIKKELNLDNIIEKATHSVEDEIVQPLTREANEVDKTLNSISYTKPNSSSVYQGDAEAENEQQELAAEHAQPIDTKTDGISIISSSQKTEVKEDKA